MSTEPDFASGFGAVRHHMTEEAAAGTNVELFARGPRPGWMSLGNDLERSGVTAAELAALKALVATEEARHAAQQLSDNRTADTDGVLQPKEDPMYSWIAPNPYRHYNRFKVWFRDIEGDRKSLTFATEAEADSWIADSPTAAGGEHGRPIEDVVSAYLDSLTDRKPSTLVTLRYRLTQPHQRAASACPIQAFPWRRGLGGARGQAEQGEPNRHPGCTSRPDQLQRASRGRCSAGSSRGVRKEGKDQLHIDEAQGYSWPRAWRP